MSTQSAAVPDLRYPVGRFKRPDKITAALRQEWLSDIEALPDKLTEAVAGLDEQAT